MEGRKAPLNREEGGRTGSHFAGGVLADVGPTRKTFDQMGADLLTIGRTRGHLSCQAFLCAFGDFISLSLSRTDIITYNYCSR